MGKLLVGEAQAASASMSELTVVPTAPAAKLWRLTDPAASPIEICAVSSPAELRQFVRFPAQLHAEGGPWVKPLEMERLDFLDPRRNPWFEFGSAALFLARKNGQLVGRIAAADDPRFNAFHQSRTGLFGLFESIDDPEVARALIGVAARWLEARGHRKLLGPLGFSTNYECGVLIDAFDRAPSVLMPYNPPYYGALLEGSGLTKAKDLWAWDLEQLTAPAWAGALCDRLRARKKITIRPLDVKGWGSEVVRLQTIYNEAWERNWGFVPMTDHEFKRMADDLRTIADPRMVLVAEIEGEAAAFSMTIPDANRALKAADGRLTHYGLPLGLARLLLAQRKVDTLRFVTLGVKARFRKRGIETVLYVETLRAAQRLGYRSIEMSWTLEDNVLINREIEAMGGRRSKTYRLYEGDL